MTASNVLDYVSKRPGVHFNEIVNEVDISPDKLLRVGEELVAKGAIETAELYGKTHYYPPSYDGWEQKAIALLRRETSRDILILLLEVESASPGEIADAVGIARGTLEWHLERLIDAGLVEKNRDEWPIIIEVTEPAAVRRLLDEIEPTTSDRWVDRTTRLVDHFLESSE